MGKIIPLNKYSNQNKNNATPIREVVNDLHQLMYKIEIHLKTNDNGKSYINRRR